MYFHDKININSCYSSKYNIVVIIILLIIVSLKYKTKKENKQENNINRYMICALQHDDDNEYEVEIYIPIF